MLSNVIINLPVMASRGHSLTLGDKLHESPSLFPRHATIFQVIICKLTVTPISMEPVKVGAVTSLHTILLWVCNYVVKKLPTAAVCHTCIHAFPDHKNHWYIYIHTHLVFVFSFFETRFHISWMTLNSLCHWDWPWTPFSCLHFSSAGIIVIYHHACLCLSF